MTELRTPVRDCLERGLPEETAQRVWAGVAERRERRRVRRRSVPMLLAASLVLAIAAMLPWLRGGEPEVLARRDGQRLLALDGREQPVTALSDGSAIELDARARLEVLHNDGRVFVSVLRRGAATFDVRPGGARRWTIETSLGSVDVIGTRFTVEKDERSVRVAVSRGVVVVRAETLPERVRRLEAGEAVVLTNSTAPAGPRELEVPTPSEVFVAPEARASSAPLAAVSTTPRVEARVPAVVAPLSFDARLALADRERAAGNRAGAVEQLRAALLDPAGGARRAPAAFALGRSLLELGRYSEAANAFDVCLRASPPEALAEDAWARRIEAEARAGQLERARALAATYESRYPRGARLAEVKRWLGER